MSIKQYWYSPTYKEYGYGLFIFKIDDMFFLGYIDKYGNEISIILDVKSFNALKKIWE